MLTFLMAVRDAVVTTFLSFAGVDLAPNASVSSLPAYEVSAQSAADLAERTLEADVKRAPEDEGWFKVRGPEFRFPRIR
jgi:hypothetical protein